MELLNDVIEPVTFVSSAGQGVTYVPYTGGLRSKVPLVWGSLMLATNYIYACNTDVYIVYYVCASCSHALYMDTIAETAQKAQGSHRCKVLCSTPDP